VNLRRRGSSGRRASRRGYLGAAFVAVVLLAAAVPAFSLARFTDFGTSGGSFTSDTLAPPTSLAATGGASVTLTWTPTVDTYATGYDVLRGSVTGGPYVQVGSATPRSASTTTDGPAAGTWFYVLRSVYQSWRSVNSNQASAIVGTPTSTGIKSCLPASNAPDTSGAGDNNGYESNPGRVCVDDGSAATDTTTGIDGTASCGTGATPNPAKDRHRFWGYAFGLPGTVSSISGITVRADVGMNNNGGTSNICTQLSWDGGTTWTTIKSLLVTGTAQAAYTFGSATDTWGRTWAVGEFSPATFRVRVIDASSQPMKQFQLDYLGVTVSYYP
jgi:hypothetical protein